MRKMNEETKAELTERMALIKKKGYWDGFASDYRRAIEFYKNAETAFRTGTKRTVSGENEAKMAGRYVNILESRVYFDNAGMFAGKTAMERLAMYEALQPVIEKISKTA